MTTFAIKPPGAAQNRRKAKDDKKAEQGRDRAAQRDVERCLWPGTWVERAAKMLRIDLKAAGIEYVDASGRVFDFHAQRHQFITNLARSGVHPKNAQALARHSTITLTMDRYSHVGVFDMSAGLDALPALPIDGPANEAAELRATGTDGVCDQPFNLVVQGVAQNSENSCPTVSPDDHEAGESGRAEKPAKPGVFACFAGDSVSSGAGIRTPDTRIMIPLAAARNAQAGKDLGHAENPVTVPVTGKVRKSTPKNAVKATAGDHLETIVEALRRLPEGQQAEVVRRLGDPQPDADLAAILANWPKLSSGVRAGVVQAVEGFAKAAGSVP